MKWVDYRERLNLGLNDSDIFDALRNKLKNYVRYSIGELYSTTSAYAFCNMIGILYEEYGPYNNWRIVTNSLNNAQNSVHLLSIFVAFCNTFHPISLFEFESDYRESDYRDIDMHEPLNYLCKTLEDLNIQYEILNDDDGAFLFPKGLKQMDDALISEILYWLNDYPKTQKRICLCIKEIF